MEKDENFPECKWEKGSIEWIAYLQGYTDGTEWAFKTAREIMKEDRK